MKTIKVQVVAKSYRDVELKRSVKQGEILEITPARLKAIQKVEKEEKTQLVEKISEPEKVDLKSTKKTAKK